MTDEANGARKRKPSTGRPLGSKNRSTLERERIVAEAEAELCGQLTPEQLEKMGPLEVMDYAMRAHVRTGNLTVAAGIAKDLAAAQDRRANPTGVVQTAADAARAAMRNAIISDPDPGRKDVGKRSDGSMPRLN